MISPLSLKQLRELLFPIQYGADGRMSLRLTIHHAVYFLLLFVLACAQPISNWLMSGMEILLAVNWALEWDVRRKWQRGIHSPLLGAFLLLMTVHLIWIAGNDNVAYGFNDLFKKLPLLAIPLVVLTSRPLRREQGWFIMGCYVITVFITSIVGYVRWLTMPDLPYRDIIPYISHIRFSLNVCMAILLLTVFLYRRLQRRAKGDRQLSRLADGVAVVMLLVLLYFLLVIRSYTGLVVLYVVAGVLLAVCWKKIPKGRWLLLVIYVGAIGVLGSAVGCQVGNYYRPVPLLQQPLATHTVNGNPYSHQHDGLMENGNYVNDYICHEELATEWAKRSTYSLADTTANGYSIFPTLIRYLNARGVAKDSVGMQLLTDSDVAAIEQGIANPVYVEGGQIQRMVYVMLFEYECYRALHVVKDFTMLQRFELWKNGWRVFLQHPLFGTGTGDVVDCCHAQLEHDNSPLAGTHKHTHNQYLTLLITFGVVGVTLIVWAFVRAFRRQRLCTKPLFVGYLTIVLVSFLTEDTLETLAGAVFCSFFFCFLAMLYSPTLPANLSSATSVPES